MMNRMNKSKSGFDSGDGVAGEMFYDFGLSSSGDDFEGGSQTYQQDSYIAGGGGGGSGEVNMSDLLMGSDNSSLNGSGMVDMDGSISWEEAFRDQSRFWVQRVIVPIVVIIGVLGNIVTIYILTRRPMRSSTNVYLSALAVSDGLFLLFSFSMSLRFYPGVDTIWIYWWYTPVGLWLTDAASSTSVWLTVSFTIERFIAVCHPMKGKILCTEERAYRVAIAVYLICFAVTSPTPFEWTVDIVGNYTIDDDGQNETIYSYSIAPTEFGRNETYRLIYHWFSSIFFVLLPVLILAVFNSFLIQAVRQSRIIRRNMTNENKNSAQRQVQTMRQENRITIILIAVVIVFLVCQLPTATVLIYTSIHNVDHGSPEDNILRGLGNIFNLLVAVNASINFLLYTALSDKYRKYFLACFPCRRRGKSRGQSNHHMMNNFDGGSRYEMDTMNTTLSLSRGTSLYSSARNSPSPYLGSGGGLRRVVTSPRTPVHKMDISPKGRRSTHISMQDPMIPSIRVDQV